MWLGCAFACVGDCGEFKFIDKKQNLELCKNNLIWWSFVHTSNMRRNRGVTEEMIGYLSFEKIH